MTRSFRPSAKALLAVLGLKAFLVTDFTNIRYLTGMQLSAGFLLVTVKDGYELYLDERYAEAAKKRSSHFTVRSISTIEKRFGTLSKIGFEATKVTVDQLRRWQRKFKNTKFVQEVDAVEGFRRAKAPDELAHIRRACAITKSVLKDIPLWLKSGISERQLSAKIQCECLCRGADGMAFDTIVSFGENTARPHHHPTNRKFRSGDLVQIDMGAAVSGYCSDYSRVYVTGSKTAAQRKAYAALVKAQKSAKALIKPGVTTHELDHAARAVLKAAGYDKEFCHALGHGVGLEIHEGVVLSSKRPAVKLKKNEVVTLEPGLYFEGKFGMRIEDTVVVS